LWSLLFFLSPFQNSRQLDMNGEKKILEKKERNYTDFE
jgi:hypothetical protein